ncbi:MFS transporter [Phreatobacter stygius]|uniref:MFS transporter n=1 Tax=Phreatobacter stygius TaxID=1940610 RepID=A0A4D7BEE7_9HYPH|nr:MFS transporter [Phreatobacter stygius]QCI66352.1 MFS transporter [Phreatobacter stygius]
MTTAVQDRVGAKAASVAVPAAASAATVPPAAPPASRLVFAAYAAASLLLGLTQGLGLNLVSANLTGIQGALGMTQIESNWLVAGYMATNITGMMLLYKMRTQFGLRRFAEIGLLVYVLVAFAHLVSNDLRSAVAVRAVMGFVAAPLSTLAFFYMLEKAPEAKRLSIGVCFGMLGAQVAVPLSRVISPELLEIGEWHGLYLLESGLALMSLCVILVLPLTHPPRMKVFDRADLVSFPLLAIGTGALILVLSLGRAYWWFEAPWLGVLLAVGIGAMALLAAVELNRANPIIDLRWLASREMLAFTGALMLFRVLLSEQAVGAVGLFNTLGLQNDQMIPLFWVVVIATVAGYAFTSLVVQPKRVPMLHLAALVLIAAAAWMDAQATNLTRPEQFYLSQAMMAFAGAIFLAPSMVAGLVKALQRGPSYILSFLALFLGSQTIGGLLGSAVLGTFVTIREKFHSNILSGALTLTDPVVAQRVQSYGTNYSRVLQDGALRDAQGVAALGRLATQEANVLAYNDLFLLVFAMALAGIVALVFHLILDAISASRRTALVPTN